MMNYEKIKVHFDSLTFNSDILDYDVNYYLKASLILGELPNPILQELDWDSSNFKPLLRFVAKAIVGHRRYDRFIGVLLQCIETGAYYRTEHGYSVGGDGEYRGFTGSIVPCTDEEAEIFKKWAALPFVSV